MIRFNLKNNKKGFTLLEALVAISILMVAVAAPITIAQKGLSSASYSKNQMIASYLAQDAIEYIRNVRDQTSMDPNNDIAGRPDWNDLSAFSGCLGTNVWCSIDTKAGEDGAGLVYPDEDKILDREIDGSGNFEFYGYGGGEETNFTRKINIKINPKGDNNNEALITVIVNWGGENEVVVKTLIYNI